MTDLVTLELRGAAAIVTLNRPDRGNALSREAVRALGRVGRRLDGDHEVRAVILTGAGSRAFSTGADLKERRGMSEDQVLEMLSAYRSELGWLASSHALSVAALNGAALGGGLELALLCDLRVAAAHAVLGLPETSLAVIPGAGGTQRLPRLIGPARAKEVILLGRRLSAEEALSMGLVSRVVPSEGDLLKETLELLRPVLDGAPIAQRGALRAIRASELPLEEGLDVELSAYHECLGSEDRVEALKAFEEKRAARFGGK